MSRKTNLSLTLAAVLASACGVTSPDAAVTVTPATVTLPARGSNAFAAAVTGTTYLSVKWTVQEGSSCGSVSSTGTYTAPNAGATCHVVATSAADATKSGSATVTVTGSGAVGTCNSAATQLFPPGAPWNQAIDGTALDAESGTIIAYLLANHTASARFQITFDFNLLFADGNTPHRAFTPSGDFFSPDCDPAPVPVPSNGRLEGESNYSCAADGDCHLTVVDYSTCRLHELWRANLAGGTSTGTFTSGCQAIWDLSAVPPPTGRGDFCTSADAAGLPILPLVFTADEVAAGHIDHAIRFILPNSLIRSDIYVRPGTHSTSATSGGVAAPPYTARLRLKASKDLSTLSPGARVVAQALKKYGMFLADGGNITFTAATDALAAHKWTEVGVDSSSLKSLSWSDFEVVDLGARLDYGSGSCSRTPIAR
jgi:serine/threonine-protein kinase